MPVSLGIFLQNCGGHGLDPAAARAAGEALCRCIEKRSTKHESTAESPLVTSRFPAFRLSGFPAFRLSGVLASRRSPALTGPLLSPAAPLQGLQQPVQQNPSAVVPEHQVSAIRAEIRAEDVAKRRLGGRPVGEHLAARQMYQTHGVPLESRRHHKYLIDAASTLSAALPSGPELSCPYRFFFTARRYRSRGQSRHAYLSISCCRHGIDGRAKIQYAAMRTRLHELRHGRSGDALPDDVDAVRVVDVDHAAFAANECEAIRPRLARRPALRAIRAEQRGGDGATLVCVAMKARLRAQVPRVHIRITAGGQEPSGIGGERDGSRRPIHLHVPNQGLGSGVGKQNVAVIADEGQHPPIWRRGEGLERLVLPSQQSRHPLRLARLHVEHVEERPPRHQARFLPLRSQEPCVVHGEVGNVHGV
eukprot:scaffold1370_cov271-Pinguiococcus_pyrenoidosus.AAC.4